MTAPFDEAAARKLLDAWPEVPGLDDLVAAFVEARAAVEAGCGEPVAWRAMSPVDCEWRYTEHATIGREWKESGIETTPLYTAPQPAAEAWRFDLKAAPASEYGARPTYLLITNGKHVGVGFRQLSDDPDDYEWQDEETSYVPDVIAWQHLPPPPGSSTPAAVDAVGIVERMREKWERHSRLPGEQHAQDAYEVKAEAADEILAALRGEAR